MSYIFPQCQPLHYGYTPGNVYLLTGPLEARKIQLCSYFWCIFNILSGFNRNQRFWKMQAVNLANGQVSTLLPCYANESCCHLHSPDFRNRSRPITPLFGDMHELSLSR